MRCSAPIAEKSLAWRTIVSSARDFQCRRLAVRVWGTEALCLQHLDQRRKTHEQVLTRILQIPIR